MAVDCRIGLPAGLADRRLHASQLRSGTASCAKQHIDTVPKRSNYTSCMETEAMLCFPLPDEALAPETEVPADLPIADKAQAIARAVSEHSVTLVVGATGAGKSTQLAKICLGAGRGVGAMIGHTQPRRIAARSVAARIASELGAGLGQLVGYQGALSPAHCAEHARQADDRRHPARRDSRATATCWLTTR